MQKAMIKLKIAKDWEQRMEGHWQSLPCKTQRMYIRTMFMAYLCLCALATACYWLQAAEDGKHPYKGIENKDLLQKKKNNNQIKRSEYETDGNK